MENKENIYEKPFLHNKFGCYCLKAGYLDRALKHFNEALNNLSDQTIYSNIYQNIGNVYAQKRDYKNAIINYEKVIKYSPFNVKNKENNGNEILNNNKFNSFDAFVDAYVNLSVMNLAVGNEELAFENCKTALQLKPDNYEAAVNFGDILRQLGLREYAITNTWEMILKQTNKLKPELNYQIPQFIDCKIINDDLTIKNNSEINVLCVKWGTRYNYDYVNKLYRGIIRNTTKKIIFHCFTENSEGLDPNINIIELKENWTGWWGKATLFSEDYGLTGKMFFIDLDMIITGNIDQLFECDSKFAILRTDEISCEKKNKNGYNSSVMIWNSQELSKIYHELKRNFDVINKYIVRFDFWLEMIVKNADFLQDLYPGQISDFLMSCTNEVPKNTRIVCFPRTPKPDTYPAEWIKEYWT